LYAKRSRRILRSWGREGESRGMRRREMRKIVESSNAVQSSAVMGPCNRRAEDQVGSGLMK
jgi:hypothetical protein